MSGEVEHLSNTLMWTVEMITQAGPDEHKRMANAYRKAQELVTLLPIAEEGARPRIIAWLHRSNEYRAADDIACGGWILTVNQERVNEGDQRDWRKLRTIVKRMVKLLREPAHSIHWSRTLLPSLSNTAERFWRGKSVPASASRRYTKPPAASLLPSKPCREFPLSRP